MGKGTSGTLVDRPVKTVSAYERTGTGVVPVREWSEDDRTKRAMKRLAICWIGAIPAAALPPHIPWILLMLLAGPILAMLAWRSKGTIQHCEVDCPDCGKKVPVEEQPASWPVGARCRACGNIFSIEQAAAA
jgi:hypothetical protein